MPEITDQAYLLGEQYRDSANLRARMGIYQRFGTNPYPFPRWIFDHLAFPSTAHILEIGCGPGALWRENLARVPEDWRITLSDLSPGMVEEARNNLPNDGRFTFAVCDAQALPYAEA